MQIQKIRSTYDFIHAFMKSSRINKIWNMSGIYYDVYHIFNVRHDKRDQLKKYLLENDIGTEIHYPVSPNKQKFMFNIASEHYPISEKIHKTTLSLPISYFHTEKDILTVCDVMNSWNGD